MKASRASARNVARDRTATPRQKEASSRQRHFRFVSTPLALKAPQPRRRTGPSAASSTHCVEAGRFRASSPTPARSTAATTARCAVVICRSSVALNGRGQLRRMPSPLRVAPGSRASRASPRLRSRTDRRDGPPIATGAALAPRTGLAHAVIRQAAAAENRRRQRRNAATMSSRFRLPRAARARARLLLRTPRTVDRNAVRISSRRASDSAGSGSCLAIASSSCWLRWRRAAAGEVFTAAPPRPACGARGGLRESAGRVSPSGCRERTPRPAQGCPPDRTSPGRRAGRAAARKAPPAIAA